MPKSRGIQRSYWLTRGGIGARFTTKAQRRRRLQELAANMEKDERLLAGRVRAHEKRMRDYALERDTIKSMMLYGDDDDDVQ